MTSVRGASTSPACIPEDAVTGQPSEGHVLLLEAAYRRLALHFHPDWTPPSTSGRSLDVRKQTADISLLNQAKCLLQLPHLERLVSGRAASDKEISHILSAGQAVEPALPTRLGLATEQACMFCGFGPVSVETLRYQEAVFVDRFYIEATGPMCRACGTAVGQSLLLRSLATGWWGARAFVTNLTVVFANLSALRRLRQLHQTPSKRPQTVALLKKSLK